MRKLVAELIGTFVLVFGGCGSAVFSAAFPSVGIGLLGVSFAFGLTVLGCAYGLGHVSGCHLNPAVTIGLCAAKRFSWKEMPGYVGAQVAGGLLGALALLVLLKGGPNGYDASVSGLAANGFGDHSPGGYTLLAALVAEVVLTAFFLYIILGATDGRAPVGFAPIAIGLALTLIHLISIPVRLFAAARTERISFNQIHEPCQSRIKQQIYCPTCDRTVERSELVKGYEIEKDTYVIVDDEDLKKIAPESQETMEIIEFVKLDEVDPLYFDTSYYAIPEEPGRRAYQLLLETMQRTGYAAMARIAMHQREYTVIIRPREQGLTLHTIHYANEVRAVPEYGLNRTTEIKPQEIQLAEQLVMSLAQKFDAEKFEDSYQKRVAAMIEAKSAGKKVQQTETKKLAPVIDLMAALQKSLNQSAAASEDDDTGRKPARRAGGSGNATERSAATKRRRAAG